MAEESGGVINPWAIPIPGVAADELRSAARDLTTISQDIANIGNDVKADWKSLEGPYQAPEVDDLLTKIDPVPSRGDSYRDAGKTAADALIAFADEAERLKSRLIDLRGQAVDFVESIADDDEWRKDEEKVEDHEDLRTEVTSTVKQYNDAEIECANKITALFDGTTFVPTGEKGGKEYGIGNVPDDAAMPWGAPQEVDQGWFGDIMGASGDFWAGVIQEPFAAVGLYDSENGWGVGSLDEWGGNLKQYWGDSFYGAAAMVGLYGEEGWIGEVGVTPGNWWDNFSYAWTETFHAVFPWREGLPYAFTTAGWNVVMLGAGVLLTATGYGAVLGVPMIASRVMKITDAVSGVGRNLRGADIGDSTGGGDQSAGTQGGQNSGSGQPQKHGGAQQPPGARPQEQGGPTSSSSDSGSDNGDQPGVNDMQSSVNELENKLDDSQPTSTQSQSSQTGSEEPHSSDSVPERNGEQGSGAPDLKEGDEKKSSDSRYSSPQDSEWDFSASDYDSVSVSDVEKLNERLLENGNDMEEALDYVVEQKKKELEELERLNEENRHVIGDGMELVEVASGGQEIGTGTSGDRALGPVASQHGPDSGTDKGGNHHLPKDGGSGGTGAPINTGGQVAGDVPSSGHGGPPGGPGGPHTPGGGSGTEIGGGDPEYDPMKSPEYWDQALDDARQVSTAERPPEALGKMDPKHEKEVWGKLRALRIPPEDVGKMIEGLKKDRYGEQVAQYLLDAKYENVPGYRDMILDAKTGTSKPGKVSMVPAIHMALRHADGLLGQGVNIQDVMFEVKGSEPGGKYDYDVLVKGENGTWKNGYQMKDVDTAQGVNSAAQKAIKQLTVEKAQNRYAVLDVHDSIENANPAHFARIYNLHLMSGAEFHIRFEDKVISIPENSRLLP